MAAFASSRRSGWVRVLVVILCALFIFATIATPPAYAVGETVALFGAAAVLSSAVAALGFKLSNDSDGIATLNKMVSDFAKEAWALNVLVVGNRINGLIDGMNYIKMAVHNGKTYLDERVVAWCQQWLGNNGVYDAGSFQSSRFEPGTTRHRLTDFVNPSSISWFSPFLSISGAPSGDLSSGFAFYRTLSNTYPARGWLIYATVRPSYVCIGTKDAPFDSDFHPSDNSFYFAFNWPYSWNSDCYYIDINVDSSGNISPIGTWSQLDRMITRNGYLPLVGGTYPSFFSAGTFSENSSGLSGTDTIGEDYKDKTLDQILDGLKDWAQDWYDAGADSATNAATGAIDLPVTVGDQAATANPALNPDVVYNPPFSIPWPGVRSGETSSGAISDGKANADAAETATTDVAENQSVIDSLVNWALNYINPDTGLFSKFPLCVPYDAYLLVTSSLGVDAVGSDSIFGASPGDLDGVVSQDIETYSDFQPIINIKHDFELDGATYPLELTIDLTPWQPLVTFFREGMALLLVAELIGAEFKRIRGH